MARNRKQARRKFSAPIYIDTVYQLYQYLAKLPPLNKLEMLYYGTSHCSVRTTRGAVRIIMQPTFPLYQVIKGHGHYTHVEQLVLILQERMPQLVDQEKIHAKNIVGSSSINTAYELLELFENKGLALKANFIINSGIIMCAEYSISLSRFKPASSFEPLLNNGALLYLMRSKLKPYLNKDFDQSIEEYLPVDSVLEKMRETFGTMLFIKLHALNDVVNS